MGSEPGDTGTLSGWMDRRSVRSEARWALRRALSRAMHSDRSIISSCLSV